jgi:hypothetical protein
MLLKGSKIITANEWLKYNGFKHINDCQIKTIPAGYDYGDRDFSYHTFPLYEAIDCNNPNLKISGFASLRRS